MEGVASRVRREQEGPNTVLRFVITEENGKHTVVEMRGHEIRGVLDDGDRIVLMPGSPSAFADRILRPLTVENVTTGSTVTAWRRSFPERAAKPLLTAFLSAAVSSGVTFCVSLLASGGGGGPTAGGGGGDGGEGTDWFPFEFPGAIVSILATAAFLWVVWFALLGWRRRKSGRRIWPVAPGLVLGVTIGYWAFAVNEGSTTIG
jgi:hypothetical protein